MLRLAPEAASAVKARRFVESAVRASGDPALVALDATVALLTSELVTNAVLHAAGEIDVHVVLGDGVVRVGVTDHGPGLPSRKPDDDGATTGRGLLLVERLATDWGVAPTGRGKTVWVEVAPGCAPARTPATPAWPSTWRSPTGTSAAPATRASPRA